MRFETNAVVVPMKHGLARSDLKRLAATVVVSVCLHLTLMLGVTPQSSPMRWAPGVVLEARLVVAPPLSAAQPGAPVSEDHTIAIDHAAEAAVEATQISRSSQALLPTATVSDSLDEASARHATALKTEDVAALAVPSPVDATYFPMSQLDVRPRALVPIVPEFPPGAAAANVQGRVVLLVLIDETGKVDGVSVAEAVPAGYFEESSLAALRSVRFEPGRKFNHAVRSRVLLSVNYDAMDAGGRTRE